MSKFQHGDRIRFNKKFLQNTMQYTGRSPFIKGTFNKKHESMDHYGYVHWDDEDELIASKQGQYSEEDYCQFVKENGSLICLGNIEKVK